MKTNIIVLQNHNLINYLCCLKLAKCNNIRVYIKNTAYEIAEKLLSNY